MTDPSLSSVMTHSDFLRMGQLTLVKRSKAQVRIPAFFPCPSELLPGIRDKLCTVFEAEKVSLVNREEAKAPVTPAKRRIIINKAIPLLSRVKPLKNPEETSVVSVAS